MELEYASERLATALHELGHSLGFSHPWRGVRIAGTATNNGSLVNGPQECCLASYETIMDYAGDTQLSADDVKAVGVRFKKQLIYLPKNATLLTCAYTL